MCEETGGGTHNPGMCPDKELNPQPLRYGMTLQPTESHQPGPMLYLLIAVESVVMLLLSLLILVKWVVFLIFLDQAAYRFISCMDFK